MFCAYTRPRYQVSVYKTIGPLVIVIIPDNTILLYSLAVTPPGIPFNCGKPLQPF